MTVASDLVGEWHGSVMGESASRSYDVIVFNEDGTGVVNVSGEDNWFREAFRWSVGRSTRLRLEGRHRTEVDLDRFTFQEVESTLNVEVDYGIREEDMETLGGRMRVLRFTPRPWLSMSDHYLFHRKDIRVHATFQAPCFVIEQEAADYPFRGKALSEYLAVQLEVRRIVVGARYEVYKGYCYLREIEIRGKRLGQAVNQDEESGGWWLRIDRPPLGGTVEAEELHRLVDEILRSWRRRPPQPGMANGRRVVGLLMSPQGGAPRGDEVLSFL